MPAWFNIEKLSMGLHSKHLHNLFSGVERIQPQQCNASKNFSLNCTSLKDNLLKYSPTGIFLFHTVQGFWAHDPYPWKFRV
jgi:hypothetical protein